MGRARWDADQTPVGPRDPSDPEPGVREAVMRWQRERLPWPSDVPQGERLASWWSSMQEPYEPALERPRQVPVLGGDEYRTEYPYHDRMRETLWRYLCAPQSLRRLVVAAREDGHWWRGEDAAMLLGIMAERERMADMGSSAYRQRSMARARELLQGMGYHGNEP